MVAHVYVFGFRIGFSLGTAENIAASEVTFSNRAAIGCEVGMELRAWNTLNISLNMWPMNDCKIGVHTSEATCVHAIGGSSTGNEIDFKLAVGGTFSIHNFRSEGVTQFL